MTFFAIGNHKKICMIKVSPWDLKKLGQQRVSKRMKVRMVRGAWDYAKDDPDSILGGS